MINNIEVTHALRRYPIAQFNLHQDRNGDLLLRMAGAAGETESIRNGLKRLFGAGQRLKIEMMEEFSGKMVQYTSDLI